MQSLSAKAFQGVSRLGGEAVGFGLESGSVGRVPQNGVSEVGEMDPDLVGTPRFEGTGEKAGQRLSVGSGKTFQHLPMGNRVPTILTHALFVSGVGVASEWGVDRALGAIGRTPDESQIAPLERTIGLLWEVL